MRCSFKTKLALAMGLPLLATYLGMAWCEYWLGRREALASMESHLMDLVGRWAAELDADLVSAEGLAKAVALLYATSPDLSARTIHGVIQDRLNHNPKIFGMCAAFEPTAASGQTVPSAAYWCRDPRGGLRYVDIAAKAPDFRNLDWYRPAQTGGRPFWTEPYFDFGIGERLMCTYTVPIVQGNEFCGVVTVDLVSEDLFKEISRVKVGSGYCTLMSRRGAFISHPDSSLVLRESIFGLAEQYGIEELADTGADITAGKMGVRRVRDYQTGRTRWMAYAPVQSAGWSLAAILPEDEVLSPVRARLVRSLAVLGAGLAVVLAVVLLVSLRMTRPLGELAAAAELLGSGDLDVRVPEPSGSDEIAMLALRFNTMAADLKRNMECRLRDEAQRRQAEGEWKAAREIQASLLPGMLPANLQKGFALYAVNAPARMVAGDFYDFFFLDDQRLALVIADIAGKGPPAAMYMAVVRTRLRDFASPHKTPAEVVRDVNRSLAAENEGRMFATLFLGYYNPRTGALTYVNAGHNPPYIARRNGQLESLDPTGPVVAPFPDAAFRDARCVLEEGDLLVLFTDGVTEAGGPKDELFGEQRLELLLQTSVAPSVAATCETIIAAARDHSHGDLPDDATVMALLTHPRTQPRAQPLSGTSAAGGIAEAILAETAQDALQQRPSKTVVPHIPAEAPRATGASSPKVSLIHTSSASPAYS